MYLPVSRGLHALNMQTYGKAVCPVLTLNKIYEGALIFTEHTIKVSCLHLVSRLETQHKKGKMHMYDMYWTRLEEKLFKEDTEKELIV